MPLFLCYPLCITPHPLYCLLCMYRRNGENGYLSLFYESFCPRFFSYYILCYFFPILFHPQTHIFIIRGSLIIVDLHFILSWCLQHLSTSSHPTCIHLECFILIVGNEYSFLQPGLCHVPVTSLSIFVCMHAHT